MHKGRTSKKVSSLVLGSSMFLMSLLPAASAFAATPQTLSMTGPSNVTVSPGGSATFTVSGTGLASNEEYQFWIQSPNGQWKVAQNYSSNNSFTIQNAQQGNYLVEAYAMTPTQIKAGDWSAAIASNNGESDGIFVGSSVTVSGMPSGNVPSGTKINLTASSTGVYNPLYQFWVKLPDGSWIQSGGYGGPNWTFVTSQPGTYEVVAYAKSPLGLSNQHAALMSSTANSTFTEYGSANSVVLSPSSSSMAADGKATNTMTATVVDSNGNVVANYNGTVGVVFTNPDATPTNALNSNTAGNTPSNPYWFQATNGVATVKLAEGSSIGSSNIGDTETATPILPGMGLETSAAATINFTAPQPTYDVLAQYGNGSGPVASIPKVLSNTSSGIYLGAFAADQNQVPLPIGYGWGDVGTVVVSISGPATLTANNQYGGVVTGLKSSTLDLGAYSGTSYNTVHLIPNANADGPVTLTLTNPTNGLQIGSPITINVVPPQSALSWTETSNTPSTYTADQVASDAYAHSNPSEKANVWSSLSGGTLSPTYTIQAQDANGLSQAAQAPSLSVTTQSGQSVSNLTAKITSSITSSGTYSFTLNYTGGALAAGTYDVTVKEGLMQSLTIPVTITKGMADQIAVTPSATTSSGAQKVVDVTSASPSVNVSAQVEDVLGNPVSAPGAQVTFMATTNGALSFKGGAINASTDSTTMTVNSSGAASVSASAVSQGLAGAVDVTGVLAYNGADGTTQLDGSSSATIDEVSSQVALLAGTVHGNNYVAGTANASPPSSYPSVTVAEENAAHAVLTNGDTLNYSITSSNPAYSTVNRTAPYVNGVANIPVMSDIAGTYTVKVWDASNTSVSPITETVTIGTGAAQGIGIFSNGSELLQDVPGAITSYASGDQAINNGVSNVATTSSAASSVAVTANTPKSVWVHLTDSTGNFATAKNPVKVDLSMPGYSGSAHFETASGSIISSVTIPAGQTGVEVYVVDVNSNKAVPISASYVPVVTSSFVNKGGAATLGTTTSGLNTYSWTVDVVDQFGNPITKLTNSSFGLVDTSTSPNVTYTGTTTAASGTFSVSPVSGQAGEYTITADNSSKVSSTDVAQINADGVTLDGTF